MRPARALIGSLEILHDEPDWMGRFEIVLVDFSGATPAVASAS